MSYHMRRNIDMAPKPFGNLTYALFIDGNDAESGEEAYGKGFSENMLRAYEYMLSIADAELTLERVVKLHAVGSPKYAEYGYRRPDMSANVMDELRCLDTVDIEFKKKLIEDLPSEIIRGPINQSDGTVIWSLGTIRMEENHDFHMKPQLRKVIKKYKADLLSAQNVDGKLAALARFLRSLAWLHPFANGNGRLRNILLQHELVRLGLGDGAMMFNNNGDIYFTPTATYVGKIKEGIAAAESAKQTNTHPWYDKHRRKKHKKNFPMRSDLQKCKDAMDKIRKSIL